MTPRALLLRQADALGVLSYYLVGGLMVLIPTASTVYTALALSRRARSTSWH